MQVRLLELVQVIVQSRVIHIFDKSVLGLHVIFPLLHFFVLPVLASLPLAHLPANSRLLPRYAGYAPFIEQSNDTLAECAQWQLVRAPRR